MKPEDEDDRPPRDSPPTAEEISGLMPDPPDDRDRRRAWDPATRFAWLMRRGS